MSFRHCLFKVKVYCTWRKIGLLDELDVRYKNICRNAYTSCSILRFFIKLVEELPCIGLVLLGYSDAKDRTKFLHTISVSIPSVRCVSTFKHMH